MTMTDVPPAPHRRVDPTALVGRRVSLRYRLADGLATDVVGLLNAADADRLSVQPEWGPDVTLAPGRLVAIRQVPAPVVRPSSGIAKLGWVMDRGWPGLTRERLGGWTFKAGRGYTRRANSVLLLGDSGLPTQESVRRAEDFYDGLGLQPAFQLTSPLPGSGRPHPGPDLRDHLTARGYRPDSPAVVMVTDLTGPDATAAASRPAGPPLSGVWADRPDQTWLGLYRYRGEGPHPAALDVLTAARHQEFLSLRDGDGTVGTARLAVSHDWAGITAMEVVPDRRGQGLGRLLLTHLLTRARAAGARYAYLQVTPTNEAARGLYTQAGFEDHHCYEYLVRGPGRPDA